MRVQTTFEKFAHATQGNIFAFCLVAFRIVLGIALALVSQYVFVLDSIWDDRTWVDVLMSAIFLACAAAFVLGLFVRPGAITAAVAVLLLVVSTFSLATGVVQLALAASELLLGMFAAGGSSHAFGLDGIILRNIHRPGKVARFLFG